jgi:hypothetical protein
VGSDSSEGYHEMNVTSTPSPPLDHPFEIPFGPLFSFRHLSPGPRLAPPGYHHFSRMAESKIPQRPCILTGTSLKLAFNREIFFFKKRGGGVGTRRGGQIPLTYYVRERSRRSRPDAHARRCRIDLDNVLLF